MAQDRVQVPKGMVEWFRKANEKTPFPEISSVDPPCSPNDILHSLERIAETGVVQPDDEILYHKILLPMYQRYQQEKQ